MMTSGSTYCVTPKHKYKPNFTTWVKRKKSLIKRIWHLITGDYE